MCKTCERIKEIREIGNNIQDLKVSFCSCKVNREEARGILRYGTFGLNYCPECRKKGK